MKWVCVFLGCWALVNSGCKPLFAEQVGLSASPDGSVTVSGQGNAGQGYSIQGATNLSVPSWFNLALTNADTNGLFNFIDQSATNYSSRFYRSVRLTPIRFGRGLTAKGTVSLSGGGFLDSYNSSAGPYTNGVHGDHAVALSDSSESAAIDLRGPGRIFGMAFTGPGGTVDGTVGDVNWNQVGVQPGHSADTAEAWLQDPPPPPTSVVWSAIPPATNGVVVLNGLGPGTTNYFAASPSLSFSGTQLVITNGGEVDLYCMSALMVSGASHIYISTNNSLVAYVNGALTVGGGGVINSSGYATNCIFYGSPNCLSARFSTTQSFVGIIDAPEANIMMIGLSDMYGALIGNQIAIVGYAVHYDEALGGN